MKKMKLITVLVIVLAVISLSGCNWVEAKQLIVSNTGSTEDITGVQVQQFVGSRGMIFDDMMDDGESIVPGESRRFYIAPSTGSIGTELTIKYSNDQFEKTIRFTYDYLVNRRNRQVTVSFDGTDLSVSGSNAVPII